MQLLEKLNNVWQGIDYPFLIHGGQELRISQLLSQKFIDLSGIKAGNVIAIIGDFDPSSILTLLRLIDLGAIVVPLTKETIHQHEYFFDTAFVDVVIGNSVVKRRVLKGTHELLDQLRAEKHAGLISFTTGTTGRPKAILHDLTLFLRNSGECLSQIFTIYRKSIYVNGCLYSARMLQVYKCTLLKVCYHDHSSLTLRLSNVFQKNIGVLLDRFFEKS